MNKKSIALGTFDGFHLGHKAVIDAAKKSQYEAYVLLFCQHPLSVISNNPPPELLTSTLRDKLLAEMNITPIFIDFKEICSMSYDKFFYDILLNRLNAGELSCGENYTFGKYGKGNVALLKELCAENNINLNIAPTITYNSETICSTKIRSCLNSGDIETANKMLGRPFSFDFRVVSGDKRGRKLGFPTINQFFPENFVKLKNGVYASAVNIDDELYPAVTNFGIRPTIGTDSLRSETYIVDFEGDLYDKSVEVQILKYIRDERKFNSLRELSEQIDIDSGKSQEIFNNSLAILNKKL